MTDDQPLRIMWCDATILCTFCSWPTLDGARKTSCFWCRLFVGLRHVASSVKPSMPTAPVVWCATVIINIAKIIFSLYHAPLSEWEERKTSREWTNRSSTSQELPVVSPKTSSAWFALLKERTSFCFPCNNGCSIRECYLWKIIVKQMEMLHLAEHVTVTVDTIFFYFWHTKKWEKKICMVVDSDSHKTVPVAKNHVQFNHNIWSVGTHTRIYRDV